MTTRSIGLILALQLVGASSPRGSWCAPGEARAAGAAAEPRAGRQEQQRQQEQLQEREHLERVFRAVAAASVDAPRDAFDPHGVIAQVGRAPERLFAWVRDATSWVPYAGVLRGPDGVLMDRMGNSLDRSLLLARLLRDCGHPARLVTGTIPLARARELLEALASAPARTDQTDSAEAAQLAERNARAACVRFGLDYEELLRHQAASELETARLAEEVASRTEEQTRQIAQLVGEPARPKAAGAAPERLAALQEHWWVEYRHGQEWRTLDALLPDAAPGWRAAEPARTLDFDSAGAVPGLPATAHHTLTVRVVIEAFAGGGLRESVVLAKELRASELHDRRITLRQVPLGWPAEGLAWSKEKDPLAKFQQVVLQQKEWLPVLSVGSERVVQGSFTSTGALSTGSERGITAGVGKGVAEGFGGLDQALGGGDRKAADGVLTAQWIEYELRSPGAAPRTIRREVFDLVGPAARRRGAVAAPVAGDPQRLLRGLALLDETELLPLASRLSSGYVAAATARGFAANQELLLSLVAPADVAGSNPRSTPGAAGDAATLPGPLQALALARWSWSRDRQSLYQDSLNLVAFQVRMRPRADGEIVIAHGFDIVANSLASRERVTAGSFHARLRQGVLETQIEARLLAGFGEVQNTGELMARSPSQGNAWVPVRTPQDPIWKEIEIPPDVKCRIEEDLAAGFVAVVPRKGVALESGTAFGWWRVHPETGETLGRMEHGAGQGMVEKVIVKLIVMSPSAYALGAGHYCKKAGRTDGACNPCVIFAAGMLGFALGFTTGAVAWTLGEKSAVMFFGAGIGGAIGGGKRAAECLNKMTGL